MGEIVDALVVRRREAFGEWPRGPSAEFWRESASEQNRGWSEVATLYRRLPRGAGVELLLLCWYCEQPKRFLYRWAKTGQARFRVTASWICRKCAGLSFASEGQYDPLGWGYPRPEPWNPYVFASVEDGARFVRRVSRG